MAFDSFYTPQDGDISSQELLEMPDEDQEAFVRRWFFYLYEDPANRTPYESAEGGYQYIWGGPFDAREVIKEGFEGIVPDELIDEIVEQVEANGFFWAPTPENPEHFGYEERSADDLIPDEDDGSRDYPWQMGLPFGEPVTDPFGKRDPIADHDLIDARLERGVRASFGTTYERAVRRTTLAHAADLQALLAKSGAAKTKHGGIGHNQPPSDIELDEENKEQLTAALQDISEELGKEQPDVRKVSSAARAIQSIGKWVAQKLDMTLETFLKSLATALGTSAAAAITAAGLFGYDPVVRKAMELYQSVIDWLNAAVLPM